MWKFDFFPDVVHSNKFNSYLGHAGAAFIELVCCVITGLTIIGVGFWWRNNFDLSVRI